MKAINLEGIYTPRYVADIFRVTTESVHNWIKSGKLEGFQTPGGHYRIHASELAKFLRQSGLNPELIGDDGLQTDVVLLVRTELEMTSMRKLLQYVNGSAKVMATRNIYQGNLWLGIYRPRFFIFCVNGNDRTSQLNICRAIREIDELKKTKIIALLDHNNRYAAKEMQGTVNTFARLPITLDNLRKAMRK